MTLKNKIKLWQHQEDAIAKFSFKEAAGLFFECGCGKSATAIHLLKKLFNKHKAPLTTLILCPAIVRQNWVNEFLLHAPKAIDFIQVLDGTLVKRAKQLTDKNKFIFITNYEALDSGKVLDALAKRKPQILIVDECHRFKNPKAVRTKKAIKIADACAYKMCLSGTPILNSTLDLWAQVRILKKGILPDNYYSFLKGWCINENASKPWFSFPLWSISPSKSKELLSAIAPVSMSVTKEDALDLPPLVKTKIYVDMSTEQRRHYKEVEKNLITYIDSDACVVTNALSKATRLQQIANGLLPLTTSSENNLRLIEHNKNEVVRELMKDLGPNHKVIFWANWKPSQGELCRLADESGFGFVTILGKDSHKHREESMQAFREDESIRFAISSQAAGGIGVNLVQASYMVYVTKGYNPEHDRQSNDRAFRKGSEMHEKITRIDIITKDTIDEKIDFALEHKLKASELIKLIKEG